jgi:hypothetical protein
MSFTVRIAGVLASALALLASAGGLSSAAGDPLIGKTYAEASSAVASWNGTPKISTVVGSRLATDDCLVSSWQKSSALDSAGNRQRYIFLINLNCNDLLASAGSPGNSITSPVGQHQNELLKSAEWCSEPEQAEYAPCAPFCARNEGMCTANF